jgi:hypothetical protein
MSTALLKKSLACGPAGGGNPEGRDGVHKVEERVADKP